MRNDVKISEVLCGDYEGTLSQIEYFTKVQEVISLANAIDSTIVEGLLNLIPSRVFDNSTVEDFCELDSTIYSLMSYYIKDLKLLHNVHYTPSFMPVVSYNNMK